MGRIARWECVWKFGKRVALVSEAIALMCERIFVILMVQYMLSSHMVRGCPVSGFLAVVDLAFTGCEGQSWPFRQAIQEALGQKQPELPQVGMFLPSDMWPVQSTPKFHGRKSPP